MPHTSRKKSKPTSHDKRRHVVDENGWTHVMRGIKPSGVEFEERSYKVEGYAPSHIFEGYTLDKINEQYNTLARRWEASSCCKELVDWLDGTLLKLDSLDINQCICTGIGTFTGCRNPDYPTSCDSSMYQLAAFETILGMLKQRFDIPGIHFQDPVFNTLDKEFLQVRGYNTINDPEACNRMTPTTFFFAPGNEWKVVMDGLEIAHPALFIGNDVPEYSTFVHPYIEERHLREKRIIRDFMTDRLSRKMPEFDLSSAMYSSIFWKQNADLVTELVEDKAEGSADYSNNIFTGQDLESPVVPD